MGRGTATPHCAAALGLGLLLMAPVAVAQRATTSVASPDTTRPTTKHTPNGLRFVVHESGSGPRAAIGRRVAVRYTGFLPDGHIFDATAAWGGPMRFRVGRGEVIRGWDELLPLLAAGARVRTWIPAAMAYGAKGLLDPDNNTRFLIPPNTELVFELQVLSVR